MPGSPTEVGLSVRDGYASNSACAIGEHITRPDTRAVSKYVTLAEACSVGEHVALVDACTARVNVVDCRTSAIGVRIARAVDLAVWRCGDGGSGGGSSGGSTPSAS